MKFTINTEKLKEMVSRAIKGAGNNKLLPITGLMNIEVRDSKLILVTTDATNYLYIIEDKFIAEDCSIVVDANMFSKLVSKMTCESITLNLREDLQTLEVSGNGNYKIELPLDENGQLIKYPDPLKDRSTVDTGISFNRSTAQVVLETIKPALATTLENPCYTGYYMGESILATDTYKIASLNVKMFDVPLLISPETFDLLVVMNAEKINVTVESDTIIYSTPDCIVVGKVMDCIEDYAHEAITNLVNEEFISHCTVSKTEFLQMLDRLMIFVGPYDKNAVYLTFTNMGLQVSSKSSSGVEVLKYVTSLDFRDYTCAIDIQMLTQEVKAIQNDVIDIYYGNEMSIKMKDGNITIVVALLQDEE